MAKNTIYQQFIQLHAQKKKALAMLIDPDKQPKKKLGEHVSLAAKAGVDFIFTGSSTPLKNNFDECILTIKENAPEIPVVIFPGDRNQISSHADALLLISLISGRDAEFLIGEQVHAAFELKKSDLEIIPTGYILIDGGNITSVLRSTKTKPIPSDDLSSATATALAGEMLGLKTIYLEAGSGAKTSVSQEMIFHVRENTSVPIITGGGIRDPKTAVQSCEAGADIIVIGNLFEEDPEMLFEMTGAVHQFNLSSAFQTHSP